MGNSSNIGIGGVGNDTIKLTENQNLENPPKEPRERRLFIFILILIILCLALMTALLYFQYLNANCVIECNNYWKQQLSTSTYCFYNNRSPPNLKVNFSKLGAYNSTV